MSIIGSHAGVIFDPSPAASQGPIG